MNASILFFASLSALALLATVPAVAAPPAGEAPMTAMPDAANPVQEPQEHDIEGVDMQKMMDQCGQMRLKTKPGEALTPEMQKTMTECQEMDRTTGAAPQPDSPQPSAPLGDRRR